MTSWVFEGALLPGGEPSHIEVGSGDRQHLPGGFASVGLVDAHCHLTVGSDEIGPLLVDRETAEARLDHLARTGVSAVRDVGGDRTITLPLAAVAQRGRPEVVACGRFLSSPGRYFPRMYEPVHAEDLVQAIHAEVDAGARWVKLIGDFPGTDGITVVRGSTIEPAFDIETVRAAIEAAHSRGVRVAAHTNSAVVSELVTAGVDSVEHGTVITEADIDALARRGGAWTPTLCASVTTMASDSETARRRRQATSEHLAAMLPLARAKGVRILTGSDVVGTVAREVSLLVRHGLSTEQALAAATTEPRDYLGVGGSEDLVTYHLDPRSDPATVHEPAAVVVRGVRVR